MSYSVSALVRRARLPRAMRGRPLAKLCLLALADRCHDDGTEARPALATIAAEAEVDDTRTIATALKQLQRHGLIVEQRPPTQRRPRVWALNLDAIADLARPLSADEPVSEVQPVAPLDDEAKVSGVQFEGLGVQSAALEVQPACTRSGPLDPVHLNDHAIAAKSEGDLAAARLVIREVLTTTNDRRAWDEVVALAERECLARGIAIGEHVVPRAYVIEHMRLKLARITNPAPRRSRQLTAVSK